MHLFVSLVFCHLVFLVWEGSSLSLVLLLIISLVNLSILVYSSPVPQSLVFALLSVLLTLTCVFATTSSLLIFFIRYELSLLPVLVLIFTLGYQPEKIFASLYLLCYTVIFSSPLLIFVLRVGGGLYSCFGYVSSSSLFFIALSFLVKSPLYSIHLWLPKAHVEAPLVGSIVLAGIILKLGGFGLLILSPLLSSVCNIYIYLSVLGSVVCSVLCFRSWDIKTLVAYSSIVHIGVVTLGAFSGLELGYWVASAILMAHSLVSPLLFVIAYELYLASARRCFIYGHNSPISSSLLAILSLLCGLSFGLPPFLPFWVELSLFGALGTRMLSLVFPLCLSTFLVYLYSISFLVRSCGGVCSSSVGCVSWVYVFLPSVFLSLFGPLRSALFLI